MRLLCRVPSFSVPGRSYAVRMFPDGPGCECPAFGHSAEPKSCKHLAIYEAALHAVTRCADAGHSCQTSGDHLGAAAYGACRQCVVDLLAAAAMKVRRQYVPSAKLVDVKAKAAARVADIRARVKRKGRVKR